MWFGVSRPESISWPMYVALKTLVVKPTNALTTMNTMFRSSMNSSVPGSGLIARNDAAAINVTSDATALTAAETR
jgi:hypothetical protein